MKHETDAQIYFRAIKPLLQQAAERAKRMESPEMGKKLLDFEKEMRDRYGNKNEK